MNENTIKQIDLNGVLYDIQANELDKVTYAELKDLRDNGDLVAGHLYRITDYEFTTKQVETKSAGNVFDVIVLAVAENELSHIARAIAHEGDTYFDCNDLGAWELWYELDNDADKYAWADAENGKGVIYRMIDEKRNDCSYDFKNALFYNATLTTNTTTDKYYYTFSYIVNGALYDGTIEKQVTTCFGNSMEVYLDESNKKTLNLNVFRNNSFGDNCHNNKFGKSCYSNTFGDGCHNNKFGKSCYSNTFGDYCYDNKFGDDCNNNKFGNNCYSNTFGIRCTFSTFGKSCYYNTFEHYCQNNTFGDYCYDNKFGDDCGDNKFGHTCSFNKFGHTCSFNKFGDNCEENTFGDNCKYNDFKNSFYNNSFGNGCGNNTFGVNCRDNTFRSSCSTNSFEYGCESNTFGNNCSNNKIGYNCQSNTFENSCCFNTFANSCCFNTFANSCTKNNFGSHCNKNSFGNTCSYNYFGISCNSNTFGDDCGYNYNFGSYVFDRELNTNNTSITLNDEYYDDGSGQLVPIKHPDLSTQPSILPYKFMGNYVYERLVVTEIKTATSAGIIIKWPSSLDKTKVYLDIKAILSSNEDVTIAIPIERYYDSTIIINGSNVYWADMNKPIYLHVVYTSMSPDDGGYYYDYNNTTFNKGIILKHNGLIDTTGINYTWIEDDYKVKIYPDYVDDQTAVYSQFDPDALYMIGVFSLRGVVNPTAKFLRIGSLVFPQFPSSISYQKGDPAFIVSWPGDICNSVQQVCDGGSVDMELMENLGNVGGVLIVCVSEGVNSVYFKDSTHGSVLLTPFSARLYLLNIDYKYDSSFTITVDYTSASQKYISNAIRYSNGDTFADEGSIEGKNVSFSNVGVSSETWAFIDITLKYKG